MAQLKNTIVDGVLRVNDDIFADKLTLSNGLDFSIAQPITWTDGTYQQRIKITDDNTAGTAVFEFQQSSNSGSSFSSLMTIKDSGEVIATTFTGSLSGNATTATQAYITGDNTSGFYPVVFVNRTANGNGSLLVDSNFKSGLSYNPNTGVLCFNRVTSAHKPGGISFYSTSYYTWFDYMSNVAAGNAPTGGTPSTLGGVTAWARRSLIENSDTYGWIWESCSNTANQNPVAMMSLTSDNGTLQTKGGIISGAGLTVETTSTLKGDVTLNSKLTVNGDTILGNAASDFVTIKGTLVLEKANDLSGGANALPALIVGGTSETAHIEIDNNEIHAKGSGTTTAQLTLNNDGGLVQVGTGGLKVLGDAAFAKTVTISGKNASTSTTTGALKVDGGIGATGQVNAESFRIDNAVKFVYNSIDKCVDVIFN